MFSVATTPMIENLSLGWSLRLTGISSCVMLTGASILIRDRNASIRPGIHPCDVRLMRRKGVVLLIGYTVRISREMMTSSQIQGCSLSPEDGLTCIVLRYSRLHCQRLLVECFRDLYRSDATTRRERDCRSQCWHSHRQAPDWRGFGSLW